MTAARRTHSYQQTSVRLNAYILKKEQNTLWFKTKRAMRKLRNKNIEFQSAPPLRLTMTEAALFGVCAFVGSGCFMIWFVENLP